MKEGVQAYSPPKGKVEPDCQFSYGNDLSLHADCPNEDRCLMAELFEIV